MKLAHVSAVCISRKNSDRFYKDILGLEEVKEFILKNDLAEKLFGVACDCQVVVYTNEDFAVEVFIPELFPEKKNPFVHHCLKVGDKEKFLNKCQAAGLNVNYVPKGDKMLSFLEDFDGNLFEITE